MYISGAVRVSRSLRSAAEAVNFGEYPDGRMRIFDLMTSSLKRAPSSTAIARAHVVRNPARGTGYGIQLPVKVGTSNTFYPDFLWWVGSTCYAIDPTGAHILNEKVRGKLLTIPIPKIVLITRGRVSRDFASLESEDGWTTARPLAGRAPSPEHFHSISDVLARLAKEAGATTK